MTWRSTSRDQSGVPDEYWKRLASYRRRLRGALWVVGALTASLALYLVWAIQYSTAGSDHGDGMVLPAIAAAVLLFAWFGLIGGFVDAERAEPRIVPYFRGSVPGPDTFFNGQALALSWKHLDYLAAREGLAPLSDFGFEDDFNSEGAPWFSAREALPTVEALLQCLQEDPSLVSQTEFVVRDLERLRDKLTAAELLAVEFCLHLRADTAYTGQEFDNRKGRYWG